MRRSLDSDQVDNRLLVAVAVTAFVSGLGAILLSPGTASIGVAVLPLGIAIVILNSLDIWLPHGDAMDVDSAIVVASAFILGIPGALGTAILGRVLAHVLRYRGGRRTQLLLVLSRRSLALGATVPVFIALEYPGISGSSPAYYLGALSAAAIYSMASLLLSQAALVLQGGRSLRQAFVGNLRFQGPLILAQVSLSVLTLVLYDDMGHWGILLTLVLLLVMRQSFAMLLEVRKAYRVTLEAFVEASQAQTTAEASTSEVVARRATDIGAAFGLYGDALERLSYAALLYSADGLDRAREGSPSEKAFDYLRDVHFLEQVLPVLELLEGRVSPSGDDPDVCVLAAILGVAVRQATGIELEPLGTLLGSLDPTASRKLEKAILVSDGPG